MRFDWKRFCTENGIRFVTEGPNTARNHISVRCPYCSTADPSQHMGLKLDIADPAWGCWRNAEHRGRNPRRLVQRLLNCSFKRALAIVQEQQSPLDEFEEAAARLAPGNAPRPFQIVPGRVLRLPGGSKPVGAVGYGKHFLAYLRDDRGFGSDAQAVSDTFRLHYNLAGEWQWRLLIPFYHEGVLVGWTGRDIRRDTKLRYRTMEDMSKDLIYNADAAIAAAEKGASLLWIVEGPFDAMKMHFYGLALGSAVVAVLGTAVTRPQVALLTRLLRQHFQNGVVMFDSDMYAVALANELETLSGRPTKVQHPPETFKDPGEMDAAAVQQCIRANAE